MEMAHEIICTPSHPARGSFALTNTLGGDEWLRSLIWVSALELLDPFSLPSIFSNCIKGKSPSAEEEHDEYPETLLLDTPSHSSELPSAPNLLLVGVESPSVTSVVLPLYFSTFADLTRRNKSWAGLLSFGRLFSPNVTEDRDLKWCGDSSVSVLSLGRSNAAAASTASELPSLFCHCICISSHEKQVKKREWVNDMKLIYIAS